MHGLKDLAITVHGLKDLMITVCRSKDLNLTSSLNFLTSMHVSFFELKSTLQASHPLPWIAIAVLIAMN